MENLRCSRLNFPSFSSARAQKFGLVLPLGWMFFVAIGKRNSEIIENIRGDKCGSSRDVQLVELNSVGPVLPVEGNLQYQGPLAKY